MRSGSSTAGALRILALILVSVAVGVAGRVAGASIVVVDSMRCKGKVIEVGDRSTELLDACGEPDRRRAFELRRKRGSPSVTARPVKVTQKRRRGRVVEFWTYERGAGRLTRTVVVSSDTVSEIHIGDRN